MSFRIVEISKPAEIHIKNRQLEIMQEEGTVYVPIEDIVHIIVSGPNIRLSTMDLLVLNQNKIVVTILDKKFLPSSFVLPFEGNVRQSKFMHKQTEFSKDGYRRLWIQIVCKKITNQARALMMLGMGEAEKVGKYARKIDLGNVDYHESLAAKEYFALFHNGLKRRSDAPINSRLNYGYAVVRGAIAREIVCVGLHPAFGLHHNNQLNYFNLADDLIEPFRPIVDMLACGLDSTNELLSREERRALACVLYNACMINDRKMSVLEAIGEVCESLKRIIGEDSAEDLHLPDILPTELLDRITE